MSRIKMIHHVNVQISDRARTREWYTRVLGAEFLDRGPALNDRQLQLRLGSAEVHFTETPDPSTIPSSHFALEVDDWEAALAHLRGLGIPHTRTFRDVSPEAQLRWRQIPGFGASAYDLGSARQAGVEQEAR